MVGIFVLPVPYCGSLYVLDAAFFFGIIIIIIFTYIYCILCHIIYYFPIYLWLCKFLHFSISAGLRLSIENGSTELSTCMLVTLLNDILCAYACNMFYHLTIETRHHFEACSILYARIIMHIDLTCTREASATEHIHIWHISFGAQLFALFFFEMMCVAVAEPPPAPHKSCCTVYAADG